MIFRRAHPRAMRSSVAALGLGLLLISSDPRPWSSPDNGAPLAHAAGASDPTEGYGPGVRSGFAVPARGKFQTELAWFFKTNVERIMREVAAEPLHQVKVMRLKPATGGMGNQLGALANALIVAAASRRRIAVDMERGEGHGIGWMWPTMFEEPYRNWHWKSLVRDGHAGLASRTTASAKRPARYASFPSALASVQSIPNTHSSLQSPVRVGPTISST